MSRITVDLASDTKTRPTAAMRRAMAEAEVGDEQAFEDPAVNALCARTAELLGKEAAVFLPSGTMANVIAYRAHCRQGDEILLDRTAHGLGSESGAPAGVAGAMCRPLDGGRGVFTADQLDAVLHDGSARHDPRQALVLVENTSNLGGGRVWPRAVRAEVVALARRHGLRTHLDGARLLNAVVASSEPAASICQGVDSCWLDFSKGLGAPVGAVLAGDAAFIDEAWRIKQQLGGAMRQAGILAAACLFALDHNVERLALDHANAKRLAEGLADLTGVRIVPGEVETNIVFFEIDKPELTPEMFCARLVRDGVRMGVMDGGRIRAVTHLDVDDAGIERALAAARNALQG